jgi:hypothetical protein
MAGSETTLDVCREEKRRCICFDIAPPRPDIIKNDSRNIPLEEDNSVDMFLIHHMVIMLGIMMISIV